MRWLLVLVLAACGSESSGPADGSQVFASTCAPCHGPGGKPNALMTERLGVRDLTSPEFRARVTPALVEAQVRGGSKNKLMPAFAGALDDAHINAVAAYVAAKQFPGK